MIDIILDTLIDGVKLIPFLFFAFLFIELIEHKFNRHTKNIVKKSGRFGPVIGSVLGIVPQCGFSVMATNLYITRIITLGTLISVYLSTSDEMIAVMISHGTSISKVIPILLIKVVIGVIAGIVIDFIFKSEVNRDEEYSICEHDHCHCEEGIIKSSIKHTVNIIAFILVVEFVLNVIMEYGFRDVLVSFFKDNSIISIMLSSLIGLIPNCGASVVITELYLDGIVGLPSVISGLLTGSGVALLVLFKSNKNIKENFKILFLVYFIGVLGGIIVNLVSYLL